MANQEKKNPTSVRARFESGQTVLVMTDAFNFSQGNGSVVVTVGDVMTKDKQSFYTLVEDSNKTPVAEKDIYLNKNEYLAAELKRLTVVVDSIKKQLGIEQTAEPTETDETTKSSPN